MPEVVLNGCRPDNLLAYLKALGILRLVSEQVDVTARGAWRGGTLILLSRLETADLITFLLEKYVPTPIVAPWNGGSGFFKKWDIKKKRLKKSKAANALDRLEGTSSERFGPYRDEISKSKRILAKLGLPIDIAKEVDAIKGQCRQDGLSDRKTKKKIDDYLNSIMLFTARTGKLTQIFKVDKSDKDAFLADLRSKVLTDTAMLWLDSTVVLLSGREKNRTEAPVLGTGGNDGNSEFSVWFAQSVCEMIPAVEGEKPSKNSKSLLDSALFNYTTNGLSERSIGQFDPGKAGGANMTRGLEGQSFLNPWDFILMMEGALLLAGSVARRLGFGFTDNRGKAVFPFSVYASGVGYASSSDADSNGSRGEIWLPVWTRPASLVELRALFAEGRAEVAGRQSRDGVGFARAVASLGVDRGIESFVRFCFAKRNGKAYLATPLDTFKVSVRPQVNLINEIDYWLGHMRAACEDKKAPPRFKGALRQIESSILNFCRYGDASRMSAILRAIGKAERALSITQGRIGDRDMFPIPELQPEWMMACNDGSAEFRIALAIASITERADVPALRCNLEPVERKGRGYSWAKKERRVVWSGVDLCRNLTAVLERRLMDASRAGISELPLDSKYAVSLNDVAEFLVGQTDDRLIGELVWGMILIRRDHEWTKYPSAPKPETAHPLPSAYALLKLLFLSRNACLVSGTTGKPVVPEAGILMYLRALNVPGACQLAARRLRASGFIPMVGCNSRHLDFLYANPVRLSAALLIPVYDVHRLKHKVLREIESQA